MLCVVFVTGETSTELRINWNTSSKVLPVVSRATYALIWFTRTDTKAKIINSCAIDRLEGFGSFGAGGFWCSTNLSCYRQLARAVTRSTHITRLTTGFTKFHILMTTWSSWEDAAAMSKFSESWYVCWWSISYWLLYQRVHPPTVIVHTRCPAKWYINEWASWMTHDALTLSVHQGKQDISATYIKYAHKSIITTNNRPMRLGDDHNLQNYIEGDCVCESVFKLHGWQRVKVEPIKKVRYQQVLTI